LLQNRLSELQAAIEQEKQNRDLVERGGSNLTLARKKFAEGDFPMAQEKVKRACVQFKTIIQVASSSSGVEVKLPFLPYQALNDRAQTKLGAFKQDFISQGDSKLKEVSRMLESYQESDWQKGLLLRADRDLNHAKECFNVACSVDEDRTEIKQYDDKLAVLETKLRTAQMESNVQTPR